MTENAPKLTPDQARELLEKFLAGPANDEDHPPIWVFTGDRQTSYVGVGRWPHWQRRPMTAEEFATAEADSESHTGVFQASDPDRIQINRRREPLP